MRAVLLVLILAVVVIIGAIATGFLDISQVRGAQAPDIDVSRNGVTATGGQAPSFDVETGSVGVGTRDAAIKVPQLQVNPPANEAAPTQPAPAQPAQNQVSPANAL
ncbi:MAG TPA: hypothetical protein VGB39_06745 [Sphingomicrobium sp.]|jgi:hypothetical protein